MEQLQQIQIAAVLLVASLTFFFLGQLWEKSSYKMHYDSLGSEDEETLEQQLKDLKNKEEQYLKQITDLRKQLGIGTNNKKNTDL